jgi:hypothetical protein
MSSFAGPVSLGTQPTQRHHFITPHASGHGTTRAPLLHAGVLNLSREFVRKECPMRELRILLRRWEAGRVALVPVLYG